jgi:hypothetical protein
MEYPMQQLNAKQVQQVAGAGILTTTVKTGAQAGAALATGLYNAGVIAGTPVVKATTTVLKVLI